MAVNVILSGAKNLKILQSLRFFRMTKWMDTVMLSKAKHLKNYIIKR